MATDEDREVWRGNTTPVEWLVEETAGGDPLDLDGSEFVLTVAWGGVVQLTLRSADDELEIDLETSIVRWRPTAAQSREIPAGAIADYELERRWTEDGRAEQRTVGFGKMAGRGGINVDD